MDMQRFTVTGPHSVAGVAPGGVVELDVDDPSTGRLVDVGHVAPTAKATQAKLDKATTGSEGGPR